MTGSFFSILLIFIPHFFVFQKCLPIVIPKLIPPHKQVHPNIRNCQMVQLKLLICILQSFLKFLRHRNRLCLLANMIKLFFFCSGSHSFFRATSISKIEYSSLIVITLAFFFIRFRKWRPFPYSL